MSEQGRTTLKPFGKSDKKFPSRKTFRFSFKISNPSEDSCPVFDYAIHVKSKERKIKKQQEEKHKKKNGVLDPVKDGDDEEVKRIARKFEEKYGEKRGRNKSYIELGAGYDETDPFIDNTEVRDEELQEDVVTPHGGYYINIGPLELKRVQVSDQSDADDIGKHKQKKILSVIEEEEEKTQECEIKECNGDIHPGDEEDSISSKKVEVPEVKQSEEITKVPCISDNAEPIKKVKKRSVSTDHEDGSVKPKKQKTVKTLLEEKRAEETLHTEEPSKQCASATSINEAIESVVNAVNANENSNSSSASRPDSESASSACGDSEDSKPNAHVSPPQLPPNIPSDLLNLVEQVKHFAQVTENTRKTFHPKIDSCLIKIEWKSTDFSTTNRQLLYEHLASYLPCTKDTLMRKAKKLFILKKESQVENLICKLKATIDTTMPTLLENYGKACQRIAEEKSLSVPSLNGSSTKESPHNPDSASPKLPKRKFPWTDETRGYLREIVKLKNRCYKVLKPRKYSNTEYINNFLQSKIWILWPQGWMKLSILLRESNHSPVSEKSKQRRSSNHSQQQEPSKLNILESNRPVSCDSTLEPEPQRVSTPEDVLHQRLRSPVAESPHNVIKNGGDQVNLASKVTPSPVSETPSLHYSSVTNKLEASVGEKPISPISETPSLHYSSVTNKLEASVDCLSKRTKESSTCNDFNTTLSDLLKLDGVIMNGSTLPSTNVNNSQKNHSTKTENLFNSSSFISSSCNGTPGVIQSTATNERTVMRASDTVSLSTCPPSEKNTNNCAYSSPANRKEQQSSVVDGPRRRISDETTTATDILSQIISESLLAPSQPPSTTPIPSLFNTKIKDEKNSYPSKNSQELLFDVMQDLKELNHLSSRGPTESQHDSKVNSYKNSWTHSNQLTHRSSHSPFQNEFMKHVHNTLESASPSTPTSTSPYANHNMSPFENSYMNEMNHHSTFNSSPHRTVQNMSHVATPVSKVQNMNQAYVTKPLPNSGHPPSYMSQVEYNTDNQHLIGMSPTYQFGMNNWHYTGSESQSHQ